MNVTLQQAQKILTGNYTFTQLGFSMMVTRLKKLYEKDPTSLALQSCTNEMNAFLNKFSSIMGADYAIISKI